MLGVFRIATISPIISKPKLVWGFLFRSFNGFFIVTCTRYSDKKMFCIQLSTTISIHKHNTPVRTVCTQLLEPCARTPCARVSRSCKSLKKDPNPKPLCSAEMLPCLLHFAFYTTFPYHCLDLSIGTIWYIYWTFFLSLWAAENVFCPRLFPWKLVRRCLRSPITCQFVKGAECWQPV